MLGHKEETGKDRVELRAVEDGREVGLRECKSDSEGGREED